MDDLDGIILNEISHREKTPIAWFLLTCGLRKKKKSDSQKHCRMVAPKRLEGGGEKGRGWQMVTDFQL